MATKLTSDYWESRWQAGYTGWDIGAVSPPLRHFIDQLTDKQQRILIPGAGNAYEAEYLHRLGFEQVFVCDWAPSAFGRLRQVAPGFPEDHLIVSDFFALDLELDLVLEQTFFCALPPERRQDYVRQMAHLLRPGGRLAGLLFASPFPFDGPPFGGARTEYEQLLFPYFHLREMSLSPHSIPPRLGNELFFVAEKHKLEEAG
ncbi:MAG: methyltransferase domain-containing protein [Lewinella sp.]|nr:methyltransferase domain-containing protein [Lewinella sp.]